MAQRYVTDQQQVLAGLAREASGNRVATAALASPGVATAVWPAKVKSHVDYNVYKVRRVVINDAGVAPAEYGEDLDATNLAESFTAQGTLAIGTYAVVVGMGEKHVFRAEP